MAIGLVSCDKEESIVSPETQNEEIDIETKYYYNINWQENENYNPVAYRGDTIEFQIAFSGNAKIKYISVYCLTESGYKSEMPTFDWDDGYVDNCIYIDSFKDSLTYYYPLADLRFDYSSFNNLFSCSDCNSQMTSLIFEYHDSLKVVHVDTLPEFKLKRIDEYSHQRLYNIALGKDYNFKRGFSYSYSLLTTNSFLNNINCGGPCTYPNDTSLLMINIPHKDYDFILDTAITKDFIEGWQAPKGNHYFVKVEGGVNYYPDWYSPDVKFDYINSTFQIKQLYEDNEPKMTQVISPKVGELYAFHYVHSCYPTSEKSYLDVYGLIEVTHIENDNLTSLNGGDNLDYIEFRIKSYCNAFRFK